MCALHSVVLLFFVLMFFCLLNIDISTEGHKFLCTLHAVIHYSLLIIHLFFFNSRVMLIFVPNLRLKEISSHFDFIYNK